MGDDGQRLGALAGASAAVAAGEIGTLAAQKGVAYVMLDLPVLPTAEPDAAPLEAAPFARLERNDAIDVRIALGETKANRARRCEQEQRRAIVLNQEIHKGALVVESRNSRNRKRWR